MTKPLAYRTFLLTAWEERRQTADADPVWRFGLEDVRGPNRRRVFPTVEEVMRYVKEELVDQSMTVLTEDTDSSDSAASPVC